MHKCDFFQTSVKYLGHVVSKGGIFTDHEKIQCIKDWRVPETAKEVKSFLGFAGYYRRFIRHFAQIAGPLLDLTKDVKKIRKQSLVTSGPQNVRNRLRN
jgi:hypothetical protein